MEQKADLNLVLLKTKEAGESTSGNTLLGQEAFKSKKTSKFIPQTGAVQSVTVCGSLVTLYDTPGLPNSSVSEEEIKKKYLEKYEIRPCVFLLAIKADRFAQEEQEMVEKIEKLLGENRLTKTWILFTNGEQLEKRNVTIKEFIDDSEPLKKLVQKYNQRFHVVNYKSKEHSGAQYKIMISKMIQTSAGLKTSEGGWLHRRIPAIKNRAPDEHTAAASPSSRRIVLLGKSGVGKSAAGNTILGQKVFKSVMRMSSVTSECSVAHATVSGRSVSVVDTPGFFDTEMKPEELAKEIARSVYVSSPGPHAFIIVFPVNMRFTEQEEQIAKQIEMLFGEEVLKYSIILFTHADQLDGETIKEVIDDNCRLRHLIQECGGRYHVFNNRDLNNRDQVNDLLEKIDTMIEQNGGGHFSNQMYEDAERFRREEERRQREEQQREVQEMKQKLQKRIAMLKLKRDTEFDRFYRHYEQRFRFSSYIMSKLDNISVGSCIGGCIGALLGIAAGPAGVVAGAMAGVYAGAAFGASL